MPFRITLMSKAPAKETGAPDDNRGDNRQFHPHPGIGERRAEPGRREHAGEPRGCSVQHIGQQRNLDNVDTGYTCRFAVAAIGKYGPTEYRFRQYDVTDDSEYNRNVHYDRNTEEASLAEKVEVCRQGIHR